MNHPLKPPMGFKPIPLSSGEEKEDDREDQNFRDRLREWRRLDIDDLVMLAVNEDRLARMLENEIVTLGQCICEVLVCLANRLIVKLCLIVTLGQCICEV
ncbi:hypothetical protein DPMN_096851 [Dreissena polymorpha]|uniref:Uncharacterized protein n=1 Tax=Dreissena polymorpha TaxID=45954 RepID=A0A9D4LAN6_DREPO|nr:hypothetical protein DPMN_096851 [Dreissena polymorpha]